MPIPKDALNNLWNEALNHEFGISIKVEGDREVARNMLYAERRVRANPKHAELIVFAPTEPADEIFIARKEVEIDP